MKAAPPAERQGGTGAIVAACLDTQDRDLDLANRQDVRRRLLDVIGCAIGGIKANQIAPFHDLVQSWDNGPATVFGTGRRASAADAAMINAVQARAYDFEVCEIDYRQDINRSTGHIPATVDITALAAAEAAGASGAALVTAAAIGGDLAARLATAERFAPGHSFELTGTVTAFGAVAAAGRLWDLKPDQLRHAFGLVLNMVAGSFQNVWDGAGAFRLPQGMAARQALTAVTLAKRGLTGPVDPFFAPRGYFAQYTRVYDLAFLTEGLGKRWLTTGYHKAYPSCYGCHAVAEACATLATRLPGGLDAVTRLIIEMWSDTAESFLTQPFAPGDSQAKALFNIRYAAARALQSGGLSPADFGDQALNDPRTQALIRCVRIDPSLPWDWGHGVAARVHVDLANGTRLTAEAPRALGFPGRALSDADLADKFRINLRHAGIDDVETVEAALSGLQQIEDIADLGELAPRLRACHPC